MRPVGRPSPDRRVVLKERDVAGMPDLLRVEDLRIAITIERSGLEVVKGASFRITR